MHIDTEIKQRALVFPFFFIWILLLKLDTSVSVSPLCLFCLLKTLFIILHPSFYSIPGTRPPVPLVFFTTRRPVFDNDISIRNVLWSWLTHRWLREIPPPLPSDAPVRIKKNCPRESSCALSRGGILKWGDLDAVEPGRWRLSLIIWNVGLLISHNYTRCPGKNTHVGKLHFLPVCIKTVIH